MELHCADTDLLCSKTHFLILEMRPVASTASRSSGAKNISSSRIDSWQSHMYLSDQSVPAAPRSRPWNVSTKTTMAKVGIQTWRPHWRLANSSITTTTEQNNVMNNDKTILFRGLTLSLSSSSSVSSPLRADER